jgi:hypothetical protein
MAYKKMYENNNRSLTYDSKEMWKYSMATMIQTHATMELIIYMNDDQIAH